MKKQLLFSFLLILLSLGLTIPYSVISTAFVEDTMINTDSYWLQNRGFVDKIVFKVYTSDQNMLDALRRSEVDVVGQFMDESLLTSGDLNDTSILLTDTYQRGFGYLSMDSGWFPTNIRALRQGFAYSLDKQGLQDQLFGGNSQAVDSPLVPSLGWWSCEHEEADCDYPNGETYYKGQPEKANITVLSMGWYDVDGDGWREFFAGTTNAWSGEVVMNNTYGGTYQYNGYTQNGKTFGEVAAVNGVLNANDKGSDKLNSDYQNLDDWLNLDDPFNKDSDRDFDLEIAGTAGDSPIINTSVISSVQAFHDMGIGARVQWVIFSDMFPLGPPKQYHVVFRGMSDLPPNPMLLSTFVSTSAYNQQSYSWTNETFNHIYRIIETSGNESLVLEKTYDAQKILWQEQPIIVLYNKRLTSMVRSDVFEGAVTVSGEGSFGYWTLTKTHLKEIFRGDNRYPDWPIGGILNYGLAQPMGSQNTVWDNNRYTNTVMRLVEDNKLAIRHPQNLSWIPNLSKSWDLEQNVSGLVNDMGNASEVVRLVNGTKLTWRLHENMTWHDGLPVTADDVVFSYKMLKGNHSPIYFSSLRNVLWVNKTDDFTVEVYNNQSGLFELDHLNIQFYPEHIWRDISDPVNYKNSNPIGCGPYKWLSREPGEYVILERNKHYFRSVDPSKYLVTTIGKTTSTHGSTFNPLDQEGSSASGFDLALIMLTLSLVCVVKNKPKRE